MNKNVFAFTAPGTNYPEYISVNETEDPDKFTIDVRSPRKEDGSCGDTSRVTLTMQQMDELAGAVIHAVTGAAV